MKETLDLHSLDSDEALAQARNFYLDYLCFKIQSVFNSLGKKIYCGEHTELLRPLQDKMIDDNHLSFI